MWQNWTNALLGIVILGTSVLTLMGSTMLTGTALTWTLAAAGTLVAAIGIWGASDDTAIQSEAGALRHA